MHVDLGRQGAPVSRQHVANMIAARQGSVNAAPAHQLGSPGHVGVLAIDEEIGIEELAHDGDVFDHGAAIEGGGGGGSEDVFVGQVVAVIHFLAAAIQMTQHGVEIDPGGIDNGFFGNLEMAGHGEQLAADGSDFGIDLPRID